VRKILENPVHVQMSQKIPKREEYALPYEMAPIKITETKSILSP
jgi:hypothetical protein